ncbi:hypothetical protein CAPTEDRAFT_228747 [Capitella teleta]|uniref:Uncharacterized protein n=1 Tax=Capitella teleta TaxID=283909 RepID=R7UM66_CAPTE|nr:hypothetical protein CAPTEDRAFT_228747 [Capitella teleta]|eukprot:ELU07183.1 hypothetical protein CAPTEDRAFT_228747 [Capitella teleta]
MGNRNITTAREVQLPTDEEQGTGTDIWFDQKKITLYYRYDQDEMRILLVDDILGSEPCGLEYPSGKATDQMKLSSLNRDVKEEELQAYYPIEFNINNAEKIAQDSVMVSLASESKFKFLPFRLGDLYNILNLIRSLPGTDEAASMHRIRSQYPIVMDVNVTPSCIPSNEPWKYVSVKSLGPMQHLLVLASLLTFWESNTYGGRAITNHKYCTQAPGYIDAPFILEECCYLEEENMATAPSAKVVCQDSQRMRKFLCTIILCFTWVVLVFCPLLVTCLPSRRTLGAKKKQSTPIEQTDDTTVELTEEKSDILDSNKNEQEDQDDLSRRWIFLDTDPVHTLSSSIWAIIIKYLLHSPHRCIVIAMRLLFLYALGIAVGYLSYVVVQYYGSVTEFNFFFIYTRIKSAIKDYVTMDGIVVQCVIVPLMFVFLTSLTLFPFIIIPKRFAKALYWNMDCKVWGKSFPCAVGTNFARTVSPGSERISYSYLLYHNLMHRMKHVNETGFWVELWNSVVCRFCPRLRRGPSRHTPTRVPCPVQYLSLIILFPMSVMVLAFHVLPIFSVFTNIKSILTPSTCCGRSRYVWLVFTIPLTLSGLIFFFMTIFDLVSLLLCALTFLTVDVVRESGVMLPKLIFALGILSYIRQAFVDFNDKYRKLKFSVFSSALDMDGFNRVLQCDGRTPLLRISGPHGFEQSLPRKVFDRVCDVLDPHQANVGSTTVKLTTSLLTISIFFAIIWEYQIFDDVTETSEAFLSLITVSIPRLLGAMKSAGYQKVREARKSNAIQVILEEMTVPRCS